VSVFPSGNHVVRLAIQSPGFPDIPGVTVQRSFDGQLPLGSQPIHWRTTMAHRQLLTDDERQALLGIPLTLTVWRGGSPCPGPTKTSWRNGAGTPIASALPFSSLYFVTQASRSRSWSSLSGRSFSGLRPNWKFPQRHSLGMRTARRP
jgi:hypothetical protein